jgi:CRP/FNR family cyclic AMP-dependent transcriptional regulator
MLAIYGRVSPRREGRVRIVPVTREAILANHFLLRHLRPEELHRLAAASTIAHYPAHKTIFHRGDPGDSLMAVLSGHVKICTYSVNGKELTLNIIEQGGLFGEIAVLDGQTRSADAVAIGDTELLVLERRRLMPFLTGDPEIAARLIGVLCQRVRQASEQLEDALLRDAPSRLARCLLRLSKALGAPDGTGVRLSVKLSQQQLGSLTGISREITNKYIVEWTRAGYLTVTNGFIRIEDPEVFRDLSDADV